MAFADELNLYSKDWLVTLVIGFLVASYWRGTWVLLDIWLCDQPGEAGLVTGDSFCFVGIIEGPFIKQHRESGWISAGIGLALSFIGVSMMWMGLWRPDVVDITDKVHLPPTKTATRMLIVYILGFAAVNVWRGVWYLTDFFLLPNKLTVNEWGEWPLTSFWVSSIVGSSACFLMFAGSSLLAPPGIFLIDGPGVNPPPIAVTALSSYYSLTLPAGEKNPDLPKMAIWSDILISFIGIPIMVVWYWRGSWLLMDYYLWKFSPEPIDVHKSIAWSLIIGLVLMFITSETVFAFIKIKNQFVLAMLGRLRTYILAWGVVNYWRAVWYIWDEFLGGTTQWSCWIAHALPLVLLILMGCMSCILAPASTLGVDFVPHPLCADEPLFSNLPVPADDLFLLGIGREPQPLDEAELPKEAIENKKMHVCMSVSVASLVLNLKDLEEEGSEHADIEMTDMQKAAAAAVAAASPKELEMAEEKEGAIWASGATGRRGSYSSVRTRTEVAERRSSYLELQRPDLDRRVSRTGSMLASRRESGIEGGAVRRCSDLFRNR